MSGAYVRSMRGVVLRLFGRSEVRRRRHWQGLGRSAVEVMEPRVVLTDGDVFETDNTPETARVIGLNQTQTG